MSRLTKGNNSHGLEEVRHSLGRTTLLIGEVHGLIALTLGHPGLRTKVTYFLKGTSQLRDWKRRFFREQISVPLPAPK
jgi:hypothetical protein